MARQITSNPNRRAPTVRRGFSLVEVMTVLIILGILSGIAISKSSSLTQSRERTAALLTVRDLSYVRDLAVQTGSPTWVDCILSSELIEYRQGATRAAATQIANPATGTNYTTQLDTTADGSSLKSIQLGTINGSSSTYQFGFDTWGRPVNSAGTLLTTTINLTVTTGGAYSQCTVTIQPESGLVTSDFPAN